MALAFVRLPIVVIAMIDIIPYKDLIVGNKGHVIRYKDK